MALGHHEALKNMLICQLIPAAEITSDTVNSYETAQLGAGVDTWQDGEGATKYQWQKGVIVIDVGSMAASSITCGLYDDNNALTNANGDTNANKLFDLTAITEPGLYVAEFPMSKVFGESLARVVANSDAATVQRYLSLRAVVAGGAAVFSAILILWGNLGGFPVNGTELTKTWVSS
jgi:hypothetical protein